MEKKFDSRGQFVRREDPKNETVEGKHRDLCHDSPENRQEAHGRQTKEKEDRVVDKDSREKEEQDREAQTSHKELVMRITA